MLGQVAGRLRDEDEKTEHFEAALREHAEVQFFLTILIPCICEFETLPTLLLRRARLGDEKAIEQLVRLDPMTLQDPKIERWLHGVPGDERRRRQALVAGWMSRGLVGQLTRQGVKASIAGLIAVLAEQMNYAYDWSGRYKVEINSTDIFDLFAAVARDRKKGFGARDDDEDLFELVGESWRQAVSKKKRAWKSEVFDRMR